MAHPVAHKGAHLVDGACGHAMCLQRVVDRCCQVGKGVEQGAVEVEDDGRMFHVSSQKVSVWRAIMVFACPLAAKIPLLFVGACKKIPTFAKVKPHGRLSALLLSGARRSGGAAWGIHYIYYKLWK